MTYLMGERPPGFAGMGDASRVAGAFFGMHANASADHAAICASNLFMTGRSMTDTEPCMSPPMYSLMTAGALLPGLSPCRLAFEMPPLPFATKSLFPSGDTRTEVGYQPVGINPSERALPTSSTSKTASVL